MLVSTRVVVQYLRRVVEMDWRIVAIPGSRDSKRTLASFEGEN